MGIEFKTKLFGDVEIRQDFINGEEVLEVTILSNPSLPFHLRSMPHIPCLEFETKKMDSWCDYVEKEIEKYFIKLGE